MYTQGTAQIFSYDGTQIKKIARGTRLTETYDDVMYCTAVWGSEYVVMWNGTSIRWPVFRAWLLYVEKVM